MRQEAGFCCVQYAICPDQLTPLLPGGMDAAPPGFSFDTIPPIAMAMQDDACLMDPDTDFISIPESGACCRYSSSSRCDTSNFSFAILSPIEGATCNPTGSASAAIQSRYCGQYLNFALSAMTNSFICGTALLSSCSVLKEML